MPYDLEGQRKNLNESERRQLAQVIRADTHIRNKTFSLAVLNTGCRPTEARRILLRQIDFPESKLVFRTLKQRTKTPVWRSVKIPPDLTEMLREYTQGMAQDKRIWKFSRTTAWRIISDYMEVAEMLGTRANSRGMRHGYATDCRKKGLKIEDIQELLGHKRIENTLIYIGTTPDEQHEKIAQTWY